jgi:hypothetical protein
MVHVYGDVDNGISRYIRCHLARIIHSDIRYKMADDNKYTLAKVYVVSQN